MGYHLIISDDNGSMQSRYVKELAELAFFDDLTPNTIIYQGEEHWTPAQLSSSTEYSNFVADWYCAGIRAQALFREMALDHKLIVEDISQDQDSFKQYSASSQESIKRGDFLIRNARNVEIEVKCRSLWVKDDAAKTPYYKIRFSEIKRLDAMQRITGVPIIVAFFQRDGRNPVRESLRMIPVSEIVNYSKDKNQVVWYEESGKDWCVPLSIMEEGFSPIDEIRELIEASNARGGSWSVIESESQKLSARDILINAQKEHCNSIGFPFFFPSDGICFRCKSDLVSIIGLGLISEPITGCPNCCVSFCE